MKLQGDTAWRRHWSWDLLEPRTHKANLTPAPTATATSPPAARPEAKKTSAESDEEDAYSYSYYSVARDHLCI